MTTRQELYRKFGPRLLEVVILITLEEINTLRIATGLPPRTIEQMTNSLSQKLENVPPYGWEEGTE